jgi:hypothetical protein
MCCNDASRLLITVLETSEASKRVVSSVNMRLTIVFVGFQRPQRVKGQKGFGRKNRLSQETLLQMKIYH